MVCTSQVPHQQRTWHWKDWYCMFGLPLKSNFFELIISLLAPLCCRGYMLSQLVPWSSIANSFTNSEPRLFFSGQCRGLLWLVSWLFFSTSSISLLQRGRDLCGFGLLIFLSTGVWPVSQWIHCLLLRGFGPNKVHRLMCQLKDLLQSVHLHWWTPQGELQQDKIVDRWGCSHVFSVENMAKLPGFLLFAVGYFCFLWQSCSALGYPWFLEDFHSCVLICVWLKGNVCTCVNVYVCLPVCLYACKGIEMHPWYKSKRTCLINLIADWFSSLWNTLHLDQAALFLWKLQEVCDFSPSAHALSFTRDPHFCSKISALAGLANLCGPNSWFC